ncbi:FAD synthetase [Aspergillus cavernicola]|uniref:FAD synthase n=1 Tax=Aspergillus cavernicola TaxID=176166 RepID=A0ABR4IIG8_9EURO
MSQRPLPPQPTSTQLAPLPSQNSESLTTVIQACHNLICAFLARNYPHDSSQAAAQRQTRRSLDVIAEALNHYTLDQLAMSYNGGKDCLVLLVIFLAGLYPLLPLDEKRFPSIPAIYSRPAAPFTAMEEFVETSSNDYHLDIARYTMAGEMTMKASFEDYLDRHKSVKAIFVGTRSTDPFCDHLGHFNRTDGGWPDFMRINPVIDWRYAEIWAFIRELHLEYCPLYDMGYTSIGSMHDTRPNPRLLAYGSELTPIQSHRYQPAFELVHGQEDERLGRTLVRGHTPPSD